MQESERRKPEERLADRENEPIEIRLTAVEINLLIGGLALIEQEERARLNRTPSPSDDPDFTRVDRNDAQKELDAAGVLRQKLIASLESREDVPPPDQPSDT